jgi:hypothetical protein
VETSRQIWQIWAQTLHRWGLQDFAASFLEAAGPLTLLGAQVVYFGQPFFHGLDRQGHLKALAGMLESTTETAAFITLLREVRPL